MPGLRAGPSTRVVSPSGGSILITSAPRSPSCCAAHGPSTTVVQSRILTPARGPAIAFPPRVLFHLSRHEAVCETWRQPAAKFPADVTFDTDLKGCEKRFADRRFEEVVPCASILRAGWFGC